jgi:orotidine 5'-phosphate decarboxylase subfamily 1
VSSFSDLTGIDYIVGVPYGGIPFALTISRITNIPTLILRKERKSHGMKNVIEGLPSGINPSDCVVLIVDDVITSGRSLDIAVETLKTEGFSIKMKHVIANMSGKLPEHSLFKLEDFTNPPHPMQTRIKELIQSKKTNVCVAADFTSLSTIIELLKTIGHRIVCLKIHCNIVTNWSSKGAHELAQLAKRMNVLLWEDAKFCDISMVVRHQFNHGHCKISSWANLVTVCPVSGPGILSVFPVNHDGFGVILVENMSSIGSSGYNCDEYISQNRGVVVGMVTQRKTYNNLLCFTPGIALDEGTNGDQQYRTPEKALESGADILVVGRGVTGSNDPLVEVCKYVSRSFVEK